MMFLFYTRNSITKFEPKLISELVLQTVLEQPLQVADVDEDEGRGETLELPHRVHSVEQPLDEEPNV